jgi:hypothetical protein
VSTNKTPNARIGLTDTLWSLAHYVARALDELAGRKTVDGKEDWVWKTMKSMVSPNAIRGVPG